MADTTAIAEQLCSSSTIKLLSKVLIEGGELRFGDNLME